MQVILLIALLAFLLEGGIAGLLLGIAALLFGAWTIDYISARRYRWGLKSHVPPHPGVVVVAPQQKEPQDKDPLEGGSGSVNSDGTF